MTVWIKLIKRSLFEGVLQMWRNRFLSGTTIFLGAVIIFLLNFVFTAKFYTEYSLKNLESRADFAVKMRENYDAFDFDALKNELKKYELDLEIKSKTEILPNILYIKFKNLESVEDVFEILKSPRYDSVIGPWDGKGEGDFVQIIGNILKMKKGIENAIFWMVGIFLLGGILLLLNTFRLVLFTRKEEVFIARLFGADIKFIMGPFLAEGFFLGTIASILAIILYIFALREIEFLPRGETFLYFWNNIFSKEIIISGLVGMLSAWIAIKRYISGSYSK